MSLTLEWEASAIPVSRDHGMNGGANGNGAGRFHWTVDTLYRAVADGAFGINDDVELIRGDILRREPVNPPHATVVRRALRLLRRLLGERFLIMDDKPVQFAADSLLRPDVSLVAGTEEDYDHRHPAPADTRLLIEVADTSEDRDTRIKTRLYAEAGILDYRVILVNRRQVNVYRAPANGAYPAPTKLGDGDTVSPLCAPDADLAVSELFPPTDDAGNLQAAG